jgi:hypothetical protein
LGISTSTADSGLINEKEIKNIRKDNKKYFLGFILRPPIIGEMIFLPTIVGIIYTFIVRNAKCINF